MFSNSSVSSSFSSRWVGFCGSILKSTLRARPSDPLAIHRVILRVYVDPKWIRHSSNKHFLCSRCGVKRCSHVSLFKHAQPLPSTSVPITNLSQLDHTSQTALSLPSQNLDIRICFLEALSEIISLIQLLYF